MDGYDIAQICLNGHVVTSMAGSSPDFKRDHCDKCGAKTITNCQHCNEGIKGHYHVSGVIGSFDYKLPRFCENCGNPYPWIETKLDAAKELVDLMESLDREERKDLKGAIEELVRETSKVPVAKVKLKCYMKSIDSDISDGLIDILQDMLSDRLKDSILK